MTIHDFKKKGVTIKAGSVTNLTQSRFLERVNAENPKAKLCKPDGYRNFYAVLAVEPLERGRYGKSADPVPLPQKSMLHMETDFRVQYGRVTLPKVRLATLKR